MHLQTFVLRTAATLLVAGGIAACTTPGPTPPQQPVPGATPQPPRQALFIRPAAGTTVGRFDGVRNKGLDIAGNLGDPIVASADGRVVYVGGELRSYGNMVIVKHNETFLTAYAHAKTILVKEGAVVRQGQKIAEMGNSESDRVKLHFEIRKNGTAVDPEPYLNGRLQQ
ncbi:murein hydrolase activator EnvC family protein [Variovorax sp. 54]|uniref:murein hydrolase activator EnvC family protein n=1 Tax=Variovorax sp. 54 TaxID=2035212 RepID=UPI000C17BBA8|nr:peptidoglycan DD-metalloendopeptidase family protein [Variovorax sp. 54]